LAANPKFHRAIANFTVKLEGQVAKMEEAFNNGDLEELALLAHWLKGAGGTVGYDDFTEPTAELENFAKRRQTESAGEMLQRVKALARGIVPPVMEPGGGTGKTAVTEK
jgi:HPt (histidine-containing phosphotransfer) domain-containing protein